MVIVRKNCIIIIIWTFNFALRFLDTMLPLVPTAAAFMTDLCLASLYIESAYFEFYLRAFVGLCKGLRG